jgi:hypothetical protein
MQYTNTTNTRRTAAGFRTVLFLCLAAAAWADVLPAPRTLVECTDRTLIDDPSSCSMSGFDATASGSLTLSPFVSLTAEVTSGPVTDFFIPGAGVFVSAQYSFRVVGGNAGDIVPIRISTNLTSNASSFSHAYGFAEAVIHTGFGDTSVVVCTNGTCGTTDSSFSGTFSTRAFSGELGDTVQLEIEASSGDSLFAESANASADPFLFIDPSFAGAANYRIEVSDGVGNALPLATPEPGTWVLLSSVVAILAMRRRRSRNRATQNTEVVYE